MDIDKSHSPNSSTATLSETIHLSTTNATLKTSPTTCCYNPSTSTTSVLSSEKDKIEKEDQEEKRVLMEEYTNDKNKLPTIKQLQQSFNNINNNFQTTPTSNNAFSSSSSSSSSTTTTTTTTTYKVFDIPNEYLNNKVEIQANPIYNNNIKEENEKSISLPIYKITAQQYMEIATKFRQHSLQYADQILFPWLHGVDGNDYQQNLFFGVKGGKMKIPNYRGHVLIHANEMYPTVGRLIESFLPQEILMNDDNDDPSFISQFKTLSKQESQGIHLRQFKIQPYRYASISDIFIYGGNDESDYHQQKLLDIAKKFAQAHYSLYHQRQLHHEKLRKTGGKRAVVNANQLVYRTFIITDSIDTFERKYPESIWYSSNGTLMNDFSFLDRERIEMQKITSCTEITKNIWVGNTQDAPMSTDTDDLMEEDDDDALQLKQQNNYNGDNPNQFSVCIECHDLADMPSPSILTLAKETLNELAPNELPSDIIHLDMYSTASNIMTTEISYDQLNQFLSDFIHLLRFMEDLVQVYDRRILLHCSDGYTESSILALSWIMFHQKLSLPEAYIYFQEKRNFFVISTDVPLLKHIEQFIQAYHLHHQQQQQSSSSTMPSPQPSTSSLASLNLQKRKRGDESPFEASDPSFMNDMNDNHTKLHPSKKNDLFQQQKQLQQHPVHQRVLLSDQYINTISNTDTNLNEDNNNNNNNVEEDEDTLVDDYILSSDYSPSAMNTTTTTTLNTNTDIKTNTNATSVSLPMNESTSTLSSVASSIASTASSMSLSTLLLAFSSPPSPTQLQTYPWFYSPRFEGSFPSRIMSFLYLGNLNHATNPTMLKTLGVTHVVSVGENADLSTDDFRLLFLDNLYDDGIDSIKTSYQETMAFIDEAYNQGTKCLIHCRVGVSRSAAVTICYVMHHLHISLVEAYIFVRTRRLNVIIQPNLKFMFEMLQLEQQSKGQFQISWPALCHEIYLLNKSYSDE